MTNGNGSSQTEKRNIEDIPLQANMENVYSLDTTVEITNLQLHFQSHRRISAILLEMYVFKIKETTDWIHEKQSYLINSLLVKNCYVNACKKICVNHLNKGYILRPQDLNIAIDVYSMWLPCNLF